MSEKRIADIFEYKNNFSIYERIESVLIYDNKLDYDPLFTVAIPVYRPNYELLKKTIQSTLNQDCDILYEVLIVNNDPNQNSNLSIISIINHVKSVRIRLLQNKKNIGMIPNWNRCVELSSGQFITFCHADDMLKPNCLSRLVELNAKFPNKMIATSWDTIDETDKIKNKYKYPEKKAFLYKRDCFEIGLFDLYFKGVGFGVGCLFEKKKLIELGGFCNDYYPSSDFALFINYAYYYGIIFNEIPLFYYRIGNNESYNEWENFLTMDDFFRKCIRKKMKIGKTFLYLYGKAIDSYNQELLSSIWQPELKNKYICPFYKKIFVRAVLSISRIRRYSIKRIGK